MKRFTHFFSVFISGATTLAPTNYCLTIMVFIVEQKPDNNTSH
jgi:hypothetical protein